MALRKRKGSCKTKGVASYGNDMAWEMFDEMRCMAAGARFMMINRTVAGIVLLRSQMFNKLMLIIVNPVLYDAYLKTYEIKYRQSNGNTCLQIPQDRWSG